MLATRVRPEVAVIATFFWLAAAPVSAADKTAGINPGDKAESVAKLLGPPEDRQFDGKSEAWQYCSTGFANGKYTVIFFLDGRVTSLKKYSRGLGPAQPCERKFATISWGEKPDVVLEIKN